MKPYEANFNITPAKTIDPATGASACALKSHRCAGYKGDLMANANKKAKKAQPWESTDKSNNER